MPTSNEPTIGRFQRNGIGMPGRAGQGLGAISSGPPAISPTGRPRHGSTPDVGIRRGQVCVVSLTNPQLQPQQETCVLRSNPSAALHQCAGMTTKEGGIAMSGRLSILLVVVTGVVRAALRCWPLHDCCTDCVIPL
jgi:hypothetical protein